MRPQPKDAASAKSRVWLAASVLLAGILAPVHAVAVEFTELSGEQEEKRLVESSNGVISLTWRSSGEAEGKEGEDGDRSTYVVQQARSEDFADAEVRYRGGQSATYLTGLAEGSYYYRVKVEGGDWSEPLRVEVEFIERGRLFLLLGIGFTVVAVTVAGIVTGSLRSRSES